MVVPDSSKTLREGALAPWNPISSNYYPQMLGQAMIQFGIDMDKPFEDLSPEDRHLISMVLRGKEFHFHYERMNLVGVRDIDIPLKGSLPILIAVTTKRLATLLAIRCCPYMNELTCATCHGYRLNDQALSVRVGGEREATYWANLGLVH